MVSLTGRGVTLSLRGREESRVSRVRLCVLANERRPSSRHWDRVLHHHTGTLSLYTTGKSPQPATHHTQITQLKRLRCARISSCSDLSLQCTGLKTASEPPESPPEKFSAGAAVAGEEYSIITCEGTWAYHQQQRGAVNLEIDHNFAP